MLLWELPYWLLWAVFSPAVIRLTERFPLERGRLLRNAWLHVAACFDSLSRTVRRTCSWAGCSTSRSIASSLHCLSSTIFCSSSICRLEVKDNGPGLHLDATTNSKRGFGFKLTRDRLERLYAAQQCFTLTDVPEGGLEVTLEIPFTTTGLVVNEPSAGAS